MRGDVTRCFDLSPSATPLFEQVNQEGDALRDVVGQLQDNVQEKQASLDNLADQIQTKMSALRERVAEEQARVEQEVDQTDRKVEEFKDAIGEVKDGIIGALEGAQQQMSDFREHVDTGRELVESANEAAQGVIGEVHDHVNSGREALGQATDFANEQVDNLQAGIDQTFQLTEQIASTVIDSVEDGLRETGSKVEEMTGVSFEDLGSAFTTGVELVQGNVIENGVNMALDALQSMIQEQLNQVIDQLVALMVETMDDVRENLFGNAEDAGLERQLLEPILDQLGNIMDPLFAAVDSISSMAAMVGIDV